MIRALVVLVGAAAGAEDEARLSDLTLRDAVAVAGDVDPDARAASLSHDASRLEAAASWTELGVDVGLASDQALSGDLPPNAWSGARASASLGVLDAPAWLDAAQQSALARAARWTAEGSRLDAQYAAAALFFAVIAAEEGRDAAQRTLAFAEGTARATRARVASGLDSELIGQSAELGLLEARAQLARAEAAADNAHVRLERAIQQPYARLDRADLTLPDGSAEGSPYLRAARAARAAARLACDEAWAELLPTATINAWAPFSTDGVSRVLEADAWTLGLSARWQLDGLAGPVLRARAADLGAQVEDIELDALERDLARDIRVARTDARAADTILEAARAAEALADSTLRAGQTRLEAGLSSPLEVLRLQDEAARARSARVSAELASMTARLEALRLEGVPWP